MMKLLLLVLCIVGLCTASKYISFGGSDDDCSAHCDDQSTDQVIPNGQEMCFWQGTKCEIGACCQCKDRGMVVTNSCSTRKRLRTYIPTHIRFRSK